MESARQNIILDRSTWHSVERTGYVGKRRAKLQAKYDTEYGKDNWQYAWEWGTQLLPLMPALQLYEDAYCNFLSANKSILNQLVTSARDIYDDAPSNIGSGIDYIHQETNVNHWHDVAIRRAVLRNGVWFSGSDLVHIRHTLSDHPLSMMLSPGQVPFHLQEMIVQPELKRWWWEQGSIESFYQSNKVLVVRIS